MRKPVWTPARHTQSHNTAPSQDGRIKIYENYKKKLQCICISALNVENFRKIELVMTLNCLKKNHGLLWKYIGKYFSGKDFWSIAVYWPLTPNKQQSSPSFRMSKCIVDKLITGTCLLILTCSIPNSHWSVMEFHSFVCLQLSQNVIFYLVCLQFR